MQKWMRLAQRDLKVMRHAVNSLELAKALEEPIAIINARRAWGKAPNLLPAGMDALLFGQKSKEEQLMGCLKMVAAVKKGDMLVFDEDPKLVYVLDRFMNSLPTFEIKPEESTVDAVKRLSLAVSAWHESAVENVLNVEAQAYGSAKEIANLALGGTPSIVSRKLDEGKRELGQDAVHSADIAATAFLSGKLAHILDDKMAEGLVWLSRIGIEEVKQYRKLDSSSKSSRNPMKKRMEAAREKFAIASPEALKEIRVQSEIEKGERGWEWELPREEEAGDCTALRGNGRTEIEDEWRLRAEYPNLYKIIRNTSTEEELLARKLKKEARFAIKEGVPSEFVRECLRTGINNADGMIELYLASGAEKKEGAAEEAAETRSNGWAGKKRWARAAAPNEAGLSGNGKKQIVNKSDLLDSIQLSPEARAHIREAGFSPKDILNTMVKGFNLGQRGNAAVGWAHLRGDIIRRNIRRYLGTEYRGKNSEKPDVEKLLDYLKSIEVVREFGSSAYTRTKDDAMSINTNPGHEIGKDIINTVNAKLIELRGQ